MIRALAIAAAVAAAHWHVDHPGSMGSIVFTGRAVPQPQLAVSIDGVSAIVCIDLSCRAVIADVPGVVAFSPSLHHPREALALGGHRGR